MKYAIQWIDHGGEFDHLMSEEDLDNALQRLGLSMDNVIQYGGVMLVGSKYEGEPDHYYYVETDVKLPDWIGYETSIERFDENLKLWFYTFIIHEAMMVERWYTVEEYEQFNSERV